MEKENHKMSLTTKILIGIVIAGTLFYTGCESYKTRELTKSETNYKEYYKTKYPIPVPEHMKGTLLDPFPPALRGYDAPELIR